MNNLYGLFNKGMPMGNMGAFMARLNEFKKTITGNPQEMVQNMLNSGKISQAQYNNAVNMANEIMKNFK